MTNVSKRKTNSEDYKIAYNELTQFIANLTAHNSSYLIDELLTEAEKIMIVKRFAAIFMFKEQYSPYRISNVLSVSVSTAQRLHEQYQSGQFDKLLSCMKRKDENRFMSLIEDVIMAQVSPRARVRLLNRVL